MLIKFPFTYILEYIPIRYTGLSTRQLGDRKIVDDFRKGHCSDSLKNAIVSKIVSNTANDPEGYVLCFIPASTKATTECRYKELSSFLKGKLKCEISMEAIFVENDIEPCDKVNAKTNLINNWGINTSVFKNKKVILLDDVITSGVSFENMAIKLMALGAASVSGMFVAKTIHPNLPIGKTAYLPWEYEDILEDFTIE